MEESKKRKLAVNWRQAAGEALLICLGVGVALLGQAWWEARTERVVVQQHFDGLLDELRRNQEGLREFEDVQNASVRRAATVLRLIGEPRSSERDDSLVAFSWTMVSHNYFVPATAAMSNLLSAGGLGLIQDPALRLKVTEYAQSVESFNSFTADLRDSSCEICVRPSARSFLWRIGDGWRIWRNAGSRFRSRRFARTRPRSGPCNSRTSSSSGWATRETWRSWMSVCAMKWRSSLSCWSRLGRGGRRLTRDVPMSQVQLIRVQIKRGETDRLVGVGL